MASSPGATVRSAPLYRWCATSAAPRAPPASPAAGWSPSRSADFLRSSLPLATQFSATPPARQRFVSFVCFLMDSASLSTTSSVTAWIEAARSISRRSSRSSGRRRAAVALLGLLEPLLGLAPRGAKQLVELAVRHGEPGAVLEVIEVEAEAA